MRLFAQLDRTLVPLFLALGAPAQEVRETFSVVPDRSEIQRAVGGGVDWLVRHQCPDGSWPGTGRGSSDIGTTALALLALGSARGQPVVRERGLACLIACLE